MVRESTREPGAPALVNLPDEPAGSTPLFAPLRDLDRRGKVIIGALILLANLPLIHYFFRHVLNPWPVTTTIPFADDFSRADIGPNYWSQGGDWRIENGALYSPGTHNNALWLQASLPADVAIEFDATPLSPEIDIRLELFGDGFNHASGYAFFYGTGPYMGGPVRGTAIVRYDEAGVVFGPDGRAAPGTDGLQAQVAGRTLDELYANGTFGPKAAWRIERHDIRPNVGEPLHMRIERKGGQLTWTVNGGVVFSVNDKYPLSGKDHDRFGLSSQEGTVSYDNLTIQPL